MELTLGLKYRGNDDDRITEDLSNCFKKSCSLMFFKDAEDWSAYNENYLYEMWIEYGLEDDKTIMFNVPLDDLEIFAHSLLKDIEMLRRDYADIIKTKRDNKDLI